MDRSAWRLAINVPEPYFYFFWVSSLAYPNLLGKKGYVVVVVARIILFAHLFTHMYFRYDQVYMAFLIFIPSFCTNKLGRAEM